MVEPTLRRRAARIRGHVLRMAHRGGAPHVDSALSIVDILTVLYDGVLRFEPGRPSDPDRDRLVLSKGHAAAALYATLAEAGTFPAEALSGFCRDGSNLAACVSHVAAPGVEASIGAPGHGLPIAVGLALGCRDREPRPRVFVLLGDGECGAGPVWESARLAAHHGLDHLVVVVDHNRVHGPTPCDATAAAAPLADRWRALHWGVREVDGHDYGGLHRALDRLPVQAGRPSLVLCHTRTGAGVSFMEERAGWHLRGPTAVELEQALLELEE